MPPLSSPFARPASGSQGAKNHDHTPKSHPKLGGKGLLLGVGGTGMKRHRKLPKDTIMGITKGDIRRLARRGGIKRISAGVYPTIREALKSHLRPIIENCSIYCEYSKRRTITVNDVIFALRRLGRPIYGFGQPSNDRPLPKNRRLREDL